MFTPSLTWKTDGKDKVKVAEEESMKDKLRDKKIRCRICGGEHFTSKCPFKDTMTPIGEDGAEGAAPGGAGGDADEEGKLGQSGSNYVPPHLRKGGAGAGERMGGKYERDDLATLRVTNVSFSSFLFLLALRFPYTLFSMRGYNRSAYADAKPSRSPNSQKNKIFVKSSNVMVESPESSLQRTGKQVVPRASLSLALRIEAMPRELAIRSMDVSHNFPFIYPPKLFFYLSTSLFYSSYTNVCAFENRRIRSSHSPCGIRKTSHIDDDTHFSLSLIGTSFYFSHLQNGHLEWEGLDLLWTRLNTASLLFHFDKLLSAKSHIGSLKFDLKLLYLDIYSRSKHGRIRSDQNLLLTT